MRCDWPVAELFLAALTATAPAARGHAEQAGAEQGQRTRFRDGFWLNKCAKIVCGAVHVEREAKPDAAVDIARHAKIPDELIQKAIVEPFPHFRTIVDTLELKILLEMDSRMSGLLTAEMTIAEGTRLMRALESAQNPGESRSES